MSAGTIVLGVCAVLVALAAAAAVVLLREPRPGSATPWQRTGIGTVHAPRIRPPGPRRGSRAPRPSRSRSPAERPADPGPGSGAVGGGS